MIEKLILDVIKNEQELSYINVLNGKYVGWVTDFGITLPNNEKMYLSLKNDNDLFFLFVLASAWSRSDKFENAAYYVSYIKYNSYYREKWIDVKFVEKEIADRKINAMLFFKDCKKNLNIRQKVSFRSDIYRSTVILSEMWEKIKEQLNFANQNNNYIGFINYLSSIEGLGAGSKKMKIKILLILRELRCQNVFNNIPGELCCVPDQRVILASEALNIKIPKHLININTIVSTSKIIYNHFGDLYDIPLFAYEDINIKNRV